MRWSIKLGEVAGIGIFVHWTFLILLGWVAHQHWQLGERWPEVAEGVGLIVCVFACVVLHELGHALTARRYGVPTRDITLYPIGGVARLERIPEEPWQEFWIAIAGPAVNVVIATVLVGALVASGVPLLDMRPLVEVGGGLFIFLAKLLAINVMLVLFNMIPAFPMDGGRVLRAILASQMDYSRATRLAANVGQALAIFAGVLAFFQSAWILMFVAFFVYIGAEQEAQNVQFRHSFRGVPVKAAMMIKYRDFAPTDPLGAVAGELLAGAQRDFPILDNGRLVGILTRDELLEGLTEFGRDAKVSDVLDADFQVVDDSASLEMVYQAIQATGQTCLPVLRDGRLLGLVSAENINEFLLIDAALMQFDRSRIGRSTTTPNQPPGDNQFDSRAMGC